MILLSMFLETTQLHVWSHKLEYNIVLQKSQNIKVYLWMLGETVQQTSASLVVCERCDENRNFHFFNGFEKYLNKFALEVMANFQY